MNKAILIGRLTNDPEMRQTQSGVAYCSFTLTIDRQYADQNGNRKTDYLPCVAWRERAEFICKYFAKGRRIAIEGVIPTRSYEAQYGSNRYITEIIVENVEFADSSPSQSGYVGHQAASAQAQPPVKDISRFMENDDDDLPF